MDRIAARAKAIILRLEVKAAIKVESGTVLVELGAHPHSVRKDEVDLFGARQERALDGGDWDALGSLLFDPFHLRDQGMGLNGNAKDDLILDDEARYRLANSHRLRGEQAEQERHEIQDCARVHLTPGPHEDRLCSKALNDQ